MGVKSSERASSMAAAKGEMPSAGMGSPAVEPALTRMDSAFFPAAVAPGPTSKGQVKSASASRYSTPARKQKRETASSGRTASVRRSSSPFSVRTRESTFSPAFSHAAPEAVQSPRHFSSSMPYVSGALSPLSGI